ncbi:MAG: substrate-binding domain-containing protein [Pseudomonadota bacterium]
MNLRELSEKLGLSQTTVSRALNGYSEVSEVTRQRVVSAAKTHNYEPAAHARSLATGQSKAIGHVIPQSTKHEMTNVVFSDFIAGAGEVYRQNGYDLVMSIVSDDDEVQAYHTLVRKRNVDGVIVHGPTRCDPRIDLLRNLQVPFVVHGRSSEICSRYSWLDVNNKRAIERATTFLVDLGHRRIALINGLERMDFAWRRRAGYLAALEAHGIGVDRALMRSAEMTEPHGYNSARQMLSASDPPTAFIASSIVVAMGIRRALEERDLKMGRDISVICFDDMISYFPNGDGEPIFTATRSSVRAAGRRCGEMLIAAIEAPGSPATQELWEAELVLGQSTGPAIKASS